MIERVSRTRLCRILNLGALMILLASGTTRADGINAEISFAPSQDSPVWMGQELTLNLDLWSNGFSFSGQQFSLPQVNGAFILQGDASTVKLNDRRGPETWQGLRYGILLYPQRNGVIEIPSFQVRFTVSAGFGTEPQSFEFQTPELSIEAELPPGADGRSLLVTTSSFDMHYQWQPEAGEGGRLALNTGDAVTLTVTRRASDVPGMVFTPLPDFEIDGIRAYPDPPEVADRINRGELVGQRVDRVTFICEQEGIFEIPEIDLQWWDPVSRRLNDERIPGIGLEVTLNPAYAGRTGDDFAADERPISISAMLTVLGGAVLMVVGLRWAANRLRPVISSWQTKRRASEGWAFRRVEDACSSGNAAAAYRAITAWMAHPQAPCRALTLQQLAVESKVADLVPEADRLQQAVVSGSAAEWNGADLARILSRLRKSSSEKVRGDARLSPLNPGA